MVGQMFDVICKQQNIALDTEVATIDPQLLELFFAYIRNGSVKYHR